mmetsp:Transcript_14170/g.40842  ORF Transcript_14170/g.40842 Transcript_14170/m.40842 type:complete len:346 (+) Transcript_14170:626-1663(+)
MSRTPPFDAKPLTSATARVSAALRTSENKEPTALWSSVHQGRCNNNFMHVVSTSSRLKAAKTSSRRALSRRVKTSITSSTFASDTAPAALFDAGAAVLPPSLPGAGAAAASNKPLMPEIWAHTELTSCVHCISMAPETSDAGMEHVDVLGNTFSNSRNSSSAAAAKSSNPSSPRLEPGPPRGEREEKLWPYSSLAPSPPPPVWNAAAASTAEAAEAWCEGPARSSCNKGSTTPAEVSDVSSSSAKQSVPPRASSSEIISWACSWLSLEAESLFNTPNNRSTKLCVLKTILERHSAAAMQASSSAMDLESRRVMSRSRMSSAPRRRRSAATSSGYLSSSTMATVEK